MPGRKTPGRICRLEDVAREMGVKPTTAQSIEQRALKKCRAYLAEHGLSIADLLDDAQSLQQIDTRAAESSFDAAAEQENMNEHLH